MVQMRDAETLGDLSQAIFLAAGATPVAALYAVGELLNYRLEAEARSRSGSTGP